MIPFGITTCAGEKAASPIADSQTVLVAQLQAMRSLFSCAASWFLQPVPFLVTSTSRACVSQSQTSRIAQSLRLGWRGHQSAWTDARTRCPTRKTATAGRLARKWESRPREGTRLTVFLPVGRQIPWRFSFRSSWHEACLAIVLAGNLSLWHQVLQTTLNYKLWS
jgi:hypothetical protein